MAGEDALTGRAVFAEPWWLDAACPGTWDAAAESRDGRVIGWLPYAVYRRDGVTWCGLPPLTRLAYPLVEVESNKPERAARARQQVETALIRRLPEASVHEFVLPPDLGNALAWQALGFEARVQHTFRVAAGTAEPVLWERLNRKTRNLIRRAQEALHPRDLDAAAFVALYDESFGTSPAADGTRVARLAAAAMHHGQGRALGVVGADGRLNAAVLFVWDARDYYYYLSARRPAGAALGAVDYLVWLGLTDAMARGLRFDFDGVSSLSRLHFLQSFGGELATRVVVSRRRVAYDGRLLLRRLRHRLTHDGEREEFP